MDGTHRVEVVRQEAHRLLGQQVAAHPPQPRVVVLEEEPVAGLGGVVQVA